MARGGIKNASGEIGLERDKLQGRMVSELEVLVQRIGCDCHQVHAFLLSDEIGGRSINLLEVRGRCRAGFCKVVEGGRMIDR